MLLMSVSAVFKNPEVFRPGTSSAYVLLSFSKEKSGIEISGSIIANFDDAKHSMQLQHLLLSLALFDARFD